MKRSLGLLLLAAVLVLGTAVSGQVRPALARDPAQGLVQPLRIDQAAAVQHDVSPPLRSMPSSSAPRSPHIQPLHVLPHVGAQPLLEPAPGASVQQSTIRPDVGTTAGLNFAGVGNGDYGFSPDAAPPDTNGAVGATQFVQWVNESFAVFDKATGALRFGPVRGNTVWHGFGGRCETNNDGDPIVQYDKAANRWILTQFSVSTTPYLQCVAVSTSPDATGSYNRYSFAYSNFPDYPKLGVWPDAYYITFNMFNGNTFVGPEVCAYDRSAMLAGTAATQQCFQLGSQYGSLLPADLDGSIAPPSGSPNFLLSFANTNALQLWKFHVDWRNPGSSTLTGPTNLPVHAFAMACGGNTCIPQRGTWQRLDSLGDRLMYRLAYRHFADGHEALVANHSVAVGWWFNSHVGVRWYELRNPAGGTMAAGTPVVYQWGTFSPDTNSRWMGSMAMDKAGDMALGYSVASSRLYPSIRYTGRVPTDPLGTLAGENSILEGAGSQSGRGLTRWGDYSAMSVDPVDDCTFWYTNEYEKQTGAFNWSTRIASFKFPGCH